MQRRQFYRAQLIHSAQKPLFKFAQRTCNAGTCGSAGDGGAGERRLVTLLRRDQSRRTTLRRELLTFKPPLYSINPSFRNLFMKKLTRERVVPTISARVS
jgi:hypothetical protein